MNILTITILTTITLSGFPLGILLKKLTKEELKQGKVWFKLIIILSILAILTSIIASKGETLILLCTSFIFIILLTLPSLIKFKRKKEGKKKG